MTECDPASKIDDLLSIIKKYNPQITERESDYLEVKLLSCYGEELWIEIEAEFSIFFGDWHTHYFAYEDEYQCFLEDLLGILENRKFTICVYRGEHWCSSCLSRSETPDEMMLRNKYGSDKVIRCSYWNKEKNVTYTPQKSS